ncbi:MAG: hypothetical protein QNJ40_00420 [Xanthomonadales bacterium]|nr:hypothetical protein [Xanthomonadales bacterium]
MDTTSRKLLTVVTEAALEARLCEALDDLGATGYTIVNARGRGSRGVRQADWSTSGNIRLEVICDEERAAEIATYLRDRYFDNFLMIIYISDVQVLREDKF